MAPSRCGPADDRLFKPNRIRARLQRRHLAEIVVFFRRRQCRMRVRRPNHAKFEGIGAKGLLKSQSSLQCFPSVFPRKHLRSLRLRTEAPLIPQLEIGELVVRRQPRVSLTRSLHLGNLVNRLPHHPPFGIFLGDGPARERLDVEHQPVRQVSVVRNGQQAATGLLFIVRHPLPQSLRIKALVLRNRNNLLGLVAAVAKYHIAVQIVPVGPRRPFESDERRESTRLVVLVRGLHEFVPVGSLQSDNFLQRVIANGQFGKSICQTPLGTRPARIAPGRESFCPTGFLTSPGPRLRWQARDPGSRRDRQSPGNQAAGSVEPATPVLDVTVAPSANRYASSGPSVQPTKPASVE